MLGSNAGMARRKPESMTRSNVFVGGGLLGTLRVMLWVGGGVGLLARMREMGLGLSSGGSVAVLGAEAMTSAMVLESGVGCRCLRTWLRRNRCRGPWLRLLLLSLPECFWRVEEVSRSV